MKALVDFEKWLQGEVASIQMTSESILIKSDALWDKDNLERVALEYGLYQERVDLLEIREK